jgi:hypothetical protein
MVNCLVAHAVSDRNVPFLDSSEIPQCAIKYVPGNFIFQTVIIAKTKRKCIFKAYNINHSV